MAIYKELEKYAEIVGKCRWSRPSDKKFGGIFKKISKYPTDIIYMKKNQKVIGGAVVFKVGYKVYGIAIVTIDPEHQGKGYGKQLMEKIHKKFKGLFLLTARNHRKGFYEKLGYVLVKKIGKRNYMAYLNDKGAINF